MQAVEHVLFLPTGFGRADAFDLLRMQIAEDIPVGNESVFLRTLQDHCLASPLATIRERARAVELTPTWIAAYSRVAEGRPFWLTMLFTTAMLAALPPEIDAFYAWLHGKMDLPPIHDIGALRDMVMHGLFDSFHARVDETLLALQWLAAARKGLSLSMLQAIAAQERPTMDVAHVFASLQSLLIVHTDTTSARSGADAVRLMLHRGMNSWFDHDLRGAVTLRPAVCNALVRWYDQTIAAAERRMMPIGYIRRLMGERQGYIVSLR